MCLIPGVTILTTSVFLRSHVTIWYGRYTPSIFSGHSFFLCINFMFAVEIKKDVTASPTYISSFSPISNVQIANFKTLTREQNPWKHDLDTFIRFSPDGYPQQSTMYFIYFFPFSFVFHVSIHRILHFFRGSKTHLLSCAFWWQV